MRTEHLPIDPVARLRERRSAKWRTFPDDVLPLPVAEMDFPLAEPVAEVLRAAIDRSDTGYAAPTRDLAEAVARYARRAWQWDIDPDGVRTVADVGMGIVEVLRRVTGPGDGVVISPPVYEPFSWWIREVGAHVVEAPPVDGPHGWCLDLDALERAFSAGATAYLLCNPHNPMGLVHRRDDLAALAELADRYGVYVLSDEIHAPLVLPGARFVPFLSVSDAARRRGFAFLSASKGWNLAGLKAATVITADPAPQRYVDRLSPHSLYRTGHLGVLATVAAFDEGGPWLADALDILDHNRGLLDDLLAELLPAVRHRRPEAGFLAWLDFRALGWGDDPAAHILDTARVALNAGHRYGTSGIGHARLNFACSPETLTEAVTRIAEAAEHPAGAPCRRRSDPAPRR
ncbi:aminotransferase class I/II-fold pyridoxal phosphate-dependent enzyme [Streptomyces sp. MZ04]|uniref:MalY/PatB family protein n=1 Tax=Streptomyces sp. MZ04 TaxID=2559236 RepID=UPI00107EB91A|nr:aminotransferase class I/II-fold pyridoxal phosphate-dependent enzyme [Streptomyces sp. MZ04]TGB14722.1 aminotransferase class I/II-fold pyridoxal phosphate-dependent enzyme [Streptomyces sp. MZ04]